MLHLDPERLAALADDEPTADEAAHLAACPMCSEERAAHRAVLALASEHAAVLSPPLTDWDSLGARLKAEGVVHDGGRAGAGGLAGGFAGWRRPRPWLQIAAGVVLAVGGGVIGRATAASSPLAGTANGSSAGGASLASRTSDTSRALATVDDALSLMRRAEGDYRLAAAFIAAHDTTGRGETAVDLYRARLAALDRVNDAALAAVNEAPADPVVNQYLMSARTARAVTVQQLNSSLPAGMSLASY